MVNFGDVRYISPFFGELEKPYVVAICVSVIVNVEVTNVGVKVIGGSNDIFV